MTVPPPAPMHPDRAKPARRPPLERAAPWVDLFFKLSTGTAAAIAVLRTLLRGLL